MTGEARNEFESRARKRKVAELKVLADSRGIGADRVADEATRAVLLADLAAIRGKESVTASTACWRAVWHALRADEMEADHPRSDVVFDAYSDAVRDPFARAG